MPCPQGAPPSESFVRFRRRPKGLSDLHHLGNGLFGDIWNRRVRGWETDRNQDEWSFVFRAAEDARKETHRARSMSEGGQAAHVERSQKKPSRYADRLLHVVMLGFGFAFSG